MLSQMKMYKDYKVGDKLVCIKDVVFNDNAFTIVNNYPICEVGGLYDVCFRADPSVYILGKGVDKKDKNILRRGSGFWFNTNLTDEYYVSDHFISLKEYRKKKLERLNVSKNIVK